MDNEENYHDEEFNPLAVLRSIFHTCEEVMEGMTESDEAIESIHHRIEHFSATFGMRLSPLSPEQEENGEDEDDVENDLVFKE